jgi:hypothetical protein
MGKGTVAVAVAVVVLSMVASGCGGDEADSSGGNGPSGSGGSAGAAGASGSVPGTHTSSGDIAVTTETCSDGPCGGALDGTTWGYTSGCINVASVLAICPQADYDIATTLSGSLVFAGDQVTRDLHIAATGTVSVPYICTLGAIDCNQVADSWRLFWLFQTGTAECVDDTEGGCDCTLTGDYTDSEVATYTVSGNTLTTVAAGVTRTFDYCAVGDELSYVETSGGPQPAVYQLTRQ